MKTLTHFELFLINGNFQIVSNGIFKSVVHRVLSHAKRDRISMAVFYSPQVGKEVGPEEGLINAETPQLFKKVKDYADIHFGFYNKGMRALHIAQV